MAAIALRGIWGVALRPFQWLRDLLTLVVGNPVISREMKVRMRFARAFWLQGAYLLFLIAIVSLAYQGIVAQTPLSHPAELQWRLQSFYATLLYSLVTVVVLIAPALTASAISFERERRTLDLLLTTPLRPMQILAGKLLASFAFLTLLLVESMPLATVCIIMGGATVGDLLATYALIAFSTLHLCAFALYCSACNRTSGIATFWAYLGVTVMLGATFWMALVEIIANVRRAVAPLGVGVVAPAEVVFPLAALHPFAAPVIKASPTKLFGVSVPCWLIGVAFSVLLTRFWLTATAAKLPAVYQGNFIGSLRRQALLLSVLSVLTLDAAFSAPLARGLNAADVTMVLLMTTGFVSLFIAPFVAWVATFGEHDGKPPADDGWFRPLQLFRPVASGALPFILTWLAVTAGTLNALMAWRFGVAPLWAPLLVGVGYCALGLTAFWAVARFWSVTLRRLTWARYLTVITLLAVVLLPLPYNAAWTPLYPFVRITEISAHPPQFALDAFVQQATVYGSVIAVITVLVGIAASLLGRRRK